MNFLKRNGIKAETEKLIFNCMVNSNFRKEIYENDGSK